jgi:hypothetical protein
VFISSTDEVHKRRELYIDLIIHDAIIQYSSCEDYCGDGRRVVNWLKDIRHQRSFEYNRGQYEARSLLLALSSMQSRGRQGWVSPGVAVTMFENAEHYSQCVICPPAYPPCPTYLQDSEERKYERLVCGTISHYENCCDGKEIVDWLLEFRRNLYAHRVTPQECKKLSLMYECGTFVSAFQAANVANRW